MNNYLCSMLFNHTKKILALLFVVCLMWLVSDTYAQCPMCRGAVESAMQQEGNTIGRGLNKGILYLLATPYILVAVVGGIWYKNNKKGKD
jgi:hypothetical protein